MKTPHILLLAALIFGAGIFAGKMAFQNPPLEPDERSSLNQRSLNPRTRRGAAPRGYSDKLASAMAHPKAGDRERELILILNAMVLTDPGQAMTLLNEINDEKLRTELGNEAAASWILSDPNQAFEWLLRQPGSPLKKGMALTMFNKTTVRNPLIAQQLFEAIPSLNSPKNIHKLAQAWARSDFEAAKNFVTSQVNPVLKKSGVLSIMEEWGRQDPAAAMAYLDESPELFAGGYGSSYNGLIRGWAEKDPAAAFEFAKGFKSGPAITGAAWSALQAWVKDDPQAAVDATMSISDKFYSTGGIAVEWAKQDLDSAKEWIKNHEHKSRYSAMRNMISNQAKEDFKQAAQLHQEFTEWEKDREPTQNESLENAGVDLARSWTRNDPDEAASMDRFTASKPRERQNY